MDKFEDMQQIDCEMHVVNLAIAYSVGLKENVRYVTTLTNDGKKVRKLEVVTPGGEFKDGARIIKTLRSIVNFLNSPQKKQYLENICKAYAIKRLRMVNYADTRVSFVTKLYQTCIFNNQVLEIMSK